MCYLYILVWCYARIKMINTRTDFFTEVTKKLKRSVGFILVKVPKNQLK